MSEVDVKKTYQVVSPLGFCRGVRRALDLFNAAIAEHGAPVYVLQELVHNRIVTEQMARDGAVFVTDLTEIPENFVVVFGAHGVTPREEELAKQRNLRVIDATCPLVSKLQSAAVAESPKHDLVMLGKKGHREVEGVIARAAAKRAFVIGSADEIATLPPLDKPLLLSQTTLHHRETVTLTELLKQRYPDLETMGGVCAASYQRQTALEKAVATADLAIIIGSKHSSNANRLREAAEERGCEAILAETIDDVPEIELKKFHHVVLSAGASTPDELIAAAEAKLKKLGYETLFP